MGALARFLLILDKLVKSGVINKIPQAIKFAKNEFGEVTPLIKKQIEKIFKTAKEPTVGTPKKGGTVIPLAKKIAEKKNEGIASLEDSSPLMDKLDKKVEGVQQDFVNPKRPGGSLDPATGITRALARRILERKRIQIGKKDPIEVFTDIFGESISDVNNLAEEMIEIDRRGGGMKDMDQMLEADGLFDIEIPTNPQKGLTDDELLDLVKKTDEETAANKRMMTADELEDFEMEISPDNLEAYNFDGTVEDGARILREEKQYMDDMELEYKKGNLDPVAGDKSLARQRFLEKKLEEMEMSGDTRLMSQDEIEELATFDLGTDMDKKSEYQKTIEAIDAFDNDINIRLIQKELKKEFPGITDEMIENILSDKNPQRIAEVKQTMREALEMQDKGMGTDEIINTFENTKRTKQATGGRIGLDSGGTAIQKLRQDLVDNMAKYAPGIPESKLQEIVKDINFDMSSEEVQKTVRTGLINLFGMATGGRVRAASGGLARILNL